MAPRYRPVPADSFVTSPFGPRWGTVHRGVDFGRHGGSANMPVYSAQGGKVVYAGAASGFGGPDPAGWVVIDHPAADGAGTTVYGHIIREVRVGQWVKAGQRIGRVNPNSNTNGGVAPHLHFEVHPYTWQQGAQINPEPWLAGCKSPGAKPAPKPKPKEASMLFGVDVSEHQDGMSLKKAAAEGMAYAIIRTTDGTYKDRTYTSHLLDAESAGLVTAAYHYLRAPSEGTTVAQQVSASVSVMGRHKRPVWIDVETEAGLHVNDIRACKREFEARGVRVIGCYSYVPYWEGRIRPGEPDSHEFGAFWVAAYGANSRGVPRSIYPGNDHHQWNYPLGNQRPVLWQFGSNGMVAGFAVDINAFRGTKAQLKVLFYGKPAVKPAPKPAVKPEPKPAVKPEPKPAVKPEPKPAVKPEPVTEAPPSPPVVEQPQEQPPAPAEDTPAPTTPNPPQPRRTVMDVLTEALARPIVGTQPGKERKPKHMAIDSYESWITSRRFWIDTLERMVRTAAQTALAVFGVPAAADAAGEPLNITADWQDKAVLIVATAMLTLITCLAGRAKGDPSTASLTSGTNNDPRA